MECTEDSSDNHGTQDERVFINCHGLLVEVPKSLRSKIHRCRNLHFRLAKTTNHITFLRRCKRNGVLPKGLTPKVPIAHQRKHLQKRLGLIFLKNQLNVLYRQRISDQREESEVRDELQKSLDIITWTKIWIWILVGEKEVFLAVRERQCVKFDNLCAMNDIHRKHQVQRSNARKVVNLSSKQLTDDQFSLLGKGLNFVPRANTHLTPGVIANTEMVDGRLGDKGQILVHITQQYVNNNHQSGIDNLTRGERKALKELSREDGLVITNSDKGKAVVVLDRGDYNSRMLDILNTDNYIKLQENPLLEKEKSLLKVVTKLRDRGLIENETLTKIRECNSRIPTIYGCPKIHKDGYPLRPVVSTCGIPWSILAKHLCQIINPIAYPENTSSVKNSQHFVALVKEQEINADCLLLSLDVKNLFGSIPVPKCLNIVQQRLEDDASLYLRTLLPISTIMELVTVCVNTTFFKFEEDYYKQCGGLAMGSPLSPALANIFLDDMEKELAEDALYSFVKFLKKFVDDYFLIWCGDREILDEFFHYINALDDNVQFTMEIESNGELPFLDVRVKRVGNTLSTTMYEKDIASGIVLNYQSEHPMRTKLNVVKNMAEKIQECSDDVGTDIKNLREKFMDNGYPEKILNTEIEKAVKGKSKNTKDKAKRLRLTVPFKARHASEFKRKTNNLNIDVGFKRGRNLGEIINKKGKCDGKRNTNVVYKLRCECGEFYVGETGRELEVRMGDHKRDILNKKQNSGVVQHVLKTGHKIDFDNVEILDREANRTKRRLRETFFIKKLNAKLNLYPGYDISDLWPT